MKRIFLLLLIFVFALKAQAQVQVSYYVVADADDWQLYMSKKILRNDLYSTSSGGKVVVITLTAGDEGNGSSTFNGAPLAYYAAKERGSVYSSKFAGDATNPSIAPNNTRPLPTAQNVTINGKAMVKYFYGNVNNIGAVVNYFLRLPDGGSAGAGYAGTGNNSLKKLKENTIGSLTSVDGAATYTWSQLVNTIYAIIFAEKGNDPQVYLNTGSSNAAIYPTEHSDHIFSSMAALEAVNTRLWVGINEFVMDYSSTYTTPPYTLSNEDYEYAAGSFGVYNWSLVKDKYPNKLTTTTRAWLPMEWFSLVRTPSGNAPLPITLLSFSGSLKGSNVLLEWSTSAEINSKEFQIEKSNDGVTYRRLNTVPAAGNSSTLKKYTYLDIEATELNYYRLKMVDLDNSYKQSNVVIVKNPGLSQSVSVLNNPFKDYINVRFAKLPKGKVAIKLIDISGKLISVSESYNPLTSIIRFDNYNKAISKGIYILQVDNEGKQYNLKLMKD